MGEKDPDSSQYKRYREKQRRNDMNAKFEEMTEVIKTIEREADEDETKSHYGATAGGHIKFKRNQVGGRGIAHLYRLNRTARKHRLAVEQLQQQLAETTKANARMSKKLKEVVHNVKHQQFQHRSLGGGVAPFPQYLPTTTSKPAPVSVVPAPPSSSVSAAAPSPTMM